MLDVPQSKYLTMESNQRKSALKYGDDGAYGLTKPLERDDDRQARCHVMLPLDLRQP